VAKKKVRPKRAPEKSKISRDTATAIQLGELTKAVAQLTDALEVLTARVSAMEARLSRVATWPAPLPPLAPLPAYPPMPDNVPPGVMWPPPWKPWRTTCNCATASSR
jgi:hypothetical protein